MTKAHILAEIRRTADANGGSPLGAQAFTRETGIRRSDWLGKHWARWGDALREAGLTPNEFQAPYDSTFLIEKLVALIQELGRFPVGGELRMKARTDKHFPSHTSFSRLGPKAVIAAQVIRYCQDRPGLEAVSAICRPFAGSPGPTAARASGPTASDGYVYLIQSGRAFKIGRTNEFHRRSREIAIELPERATTVHVIRTDAPTGIEAYWHRRFEARRGNGEWFHLSPADVQAFRRRKFM